MTDYLDFLGIRNAVKRTIKARKGSKDDLINSVINMVYVNEMINADDLFPIHWLTDFDDSKLSVAPATISAITRAANALVTTSSAHDLKAGHIVILANISGMTELNDRVFLVVSVPSTTTFTISQNTNGYTAYTSGGYAYHRGISLDSASKNVKRLLYASWNNESRMREVAPKEIESNTTYHDNDTNAIPERYFFGQSFDALGNETYQMLWYPCADGEYRLRYWFEERVSRLVNDTDVPVMPPTFHDTIVAGAVTRLIENNVQVENAVIWPQLYMNQLRRENVLIKIDG